ncbi:YhcN/YlaJ family sporulation lipoprotein [Cerasibacillus sp. JNUCC 74]
MKVKLFSFIAVLSLVLTGCMNADDNNNDNNNQDAKNDNVEQTRYNNTGGAMNGNRDYEMRRDAERDQENDNDNNRYDVSEEAAERITREVDEIDQAYVLTLDDNAYVAAQLDTNDANVENKNTGNNTANNTNNVDKGDELTDEVKSRIKEVVQSVDNDIDNVYVSTNPDFLNLTQNYTEDVEKGEPVEGFFDQFGNMIERLFPQNR